MASVEALFQALRTRRESSAKELADLLDVSQPTLSRLVRAAGERVCRIGRARSTKYVLTRLLSGLGTKIPVRLIDETGSVGEVGTPHLLAGGGHYFEKADHRDERFDGLPPFAVDMAPQGFLGHRFSATFPELGLPSRIIDWNDDHRLIALARRGEDCVGDLILGDESFTRFLQSRPEAATRADYPALVENSLRAVAGSSAGGEQPKFTAVVNGEPVLVKFASGESGRVTQRWQDLLAAESLALELLRDAGLSAAEADCFDRDGIRYLEVKRFDRVGLRGRKGMISLLALAGEYLGHLDDWTTAANDLLDQNRIGTNDARTIRWLDVFGQLIANTDRHFGNLSFFVRGDDPLELTPVYDMLPMNFAPQGTNLIEREFVPRLPSARNFDVWHEAAGWAVEYWRRLSKSEKVSKEFRRMANRCGDRVREAIERSPGMG